MNTQAGLAFIQFPPIIITILLKMLGELKAVFRFDRLDELQACLEKVQSLGLSQIRHVKMCLLFNRVAQYWIFNPKPIFSLYYRGRVLPSRMCNHKIQNHVIFILIFIYVQHSIFAIVNNRHVPLWVLIQGSSDLLFYLCCYIG